MVNVDEVKQSDALRTHADDLLGEISAAPSCFLAIRC